MSQRPQVQVHSTGDLLADAVARHVAECAQAAISANGRFTIALSGGSTPRAAYQKLAAADYPADQGRAHDWRLWQVLWGDERCVPPTDPQSNYRMAKEALLDRVPISAENVHRIHGEDDPEKAAADYERELGGLLGAAASSSTDPGNGENDCHPLTTFGAGSERSEASLRLHAEGSRDPSLALRMTTSLGVPRARSERGEGVTPGMADGLDLVLLGLGEDGHTASLFPGQASVHETKRWAMAVPAPDGKLWRVTLTPVVLNSARNVTFVVSGANKAERLQQVLEGPFNPDLLPAQAIRPRDGRLIWMVDQAAGAQLRAVIPST